MHRYDILWKHIITTGTGRVDDLSGRETPAEIFTHEGFGRRIFQMCCELYCARGPHESFSGEERIFGVRRPFSFFKDFFLLAALWIRQKLGKNWGDENLRYCSNCSDSKFHHFCSSRLALSGLKTLEID